MTTTATIPKPPAPTTGARMTLAEFFALPEMDQRCELHAGELHIMPQAIPSHQQLTNRLTWHLTAQLEDTGAAYVFPPVDVVLSDDISVAPDIVVVSVARAGIIHPARIYGAPDIVVEALSSDRRRDLIRKRDWYAAAGIPEYWIVDGATDTITILALGSDGIYHERAILTPADTLTTPLFPDFALPLAQLFNHPARIRP